jgi:uncharacterized protein
VTDVRHVPETSRFEVEAGGETAVLVYEQRPGAVALLHTVVPTSMEGRGVGSALAESALRWAGEQNLDVEPVCSFVQAYLAEHPGSAG